MRSKNTRPCPRLPLLLSLAGASNAPLCPAFVFFSLAMVLGRERRRLMEKRGEGEGKDKRINEARSPVGMGEAIMMGNDAGSLGEN
jgi:hypothetical protein